MDGNQCGIVIIIHASTCVPSFSPLRFIGQLHGGWGFKRDELTAVGSSHSKNQTRRLSCNC